jgi:hypothetical protein
MCLWCFLVDSCSNYTRLAFSIHWTMRKANVNGKTIILINTCNIYQKNYTKLLTMFSYLGLLWLVMLKI